MSGIIAVKGLSPTKQELLLFDKVLVPRAEGLIAAGSTLADYQYLLSEGIVTGYPAGFRFSDEMLELFDEILSVSIHHSIGRELFIEEMRDREIRMTCAAAQAIDNTSTYVGVFSRSPFATDGRKEQIYEVILPEFPIPSEVTPLEAIIDFRSDPDARSRYLSFRHWIASMANSDKSIPEVRDELEYLLDQYKRYLKLHRIEYGLGTMRVMCTLPLQLLENLLKLRLKGAVDALFDVRKHRVDLLKSELALPGREVSYLIFAERFFNNVHRS